MACVLDKAGLEEKRISGLHEKYKFCCVRGGM